MSCDAAQISMRTLIPHARITVVEGPGHEIYVDKPEECINAFRTFLYALG